MNKLELIKLVAAENAITNALAEKLIESTLGYIGGALALGGEVNLKDFGKFFLMHRNARIGRNPATGEAVQIAASRKVVFKAAKALRDAL